MPDSDNYNLAPSPESTLRAIFAQALARERVALPAGATRAHLRAALALDPAIISGIFTEAKAANRLAAQRPGPLQALLPAPPGAVAAKLAKSAPPQLRVRALMGALALGVAVLCIVTLGLSLRRRAPPPPPSTAALYAKANTNPTDFQALAGRAAAGDAQAEFDLANLFDTNWLPKEMAVPKNDAKAFFWYAKAAAAGIPEAENNLAFGYETGHGTAQNKILAARWYQKAALAGLANAQNSMGFLDQYGLGVPQNIQAAVTWYQKAAWAGLAVAQNNLGAAYESGDGVTQDYTLAAAWFLRAAAQGEPNAENRLGYLSYTGLGLRRNTADALQWFSAAAAQGLASAQTNLGFMYAQGIGTGPNEITAAKWFLLAEERGDTEAAVALQQLQPPLTDAQREGAELMAKDWDAANGGPK